MSKGKKKNSQTDIRALKPKCLPDHVSILERKAVEGRWYDHYAIKYCGYAFLLAIVVFAIVLRFYDISAKDVWCDEANSVIIAELNPSGIIARMSHDASPPLYYLLLHSWMYAFGETELALRSLSVLFGMMLIIALYFIGKRIFSEKVGTLCGVDCLCGPDSYHVFTANPDVHTAVPPVSSVHVLPAALYSRKKISFLAGYGIFTILSLYTHNYGLFLLPAQALLILFFLRQRQMILWWFFSVVCLVAVFALWIPSLSGQISGALKTGWRDEYWNL